jgi:hypothetical protein
MTDSGMQWIEVPFIVIEFFNLSIGMLYGNRKAGHR